MKISKWHLLVRCVLFGLLGAVVAWAGVDVFTWSGAAVYGVLLVIGMVDGLHEVAVRHRAFKAGQADMAARVLKSRYWK